MCCKEPLTPNVNPPTTHSPTTHPPKHPHSHSPTHPPTRPPIHQRKPTNAHPPPPTMNCVKYRQLVTPQVDAESWCRNGVSGKHALAVYYSSTSLRTQQRLTHQPKVAYLVSFIAPWESTHELTNECLWCIHPLSITWFAQSAVRRGGRNCTATVPGKMPA